MRFEGIQISRYGRLAEVRTPEGRLPSIVVVLGPNEGGKSTFFSFLTTLLYGFSPATRESHPYAPWSGDDAEGRAQIRLDDGTPVDIHRRLLSNGWGRMVVGDRTEDIRNQALPAVSHVPRAVFHQVYALTLAELAGLAGESWELIQDRLVGAMGSTDLVAARSVAAWFEKQAGSLWRPTRRGNQAARNLAAELTELRDTRREAVELDRTLRAKARELDAGERRLRKLREEREHEKALEYRLTRLLPLQRKLDRIAELESGVGDVAELDELPADPQGRLDELRDRYRSAEGRIKRLDEETDEPRQAIEAFTAQHRAWADNEDAVRGIADRVAGLSTLRESVETLDQEVRDFDRRCQVQSQDLFKVFWSDVDREQLDLVPTGELRDRVRKYQTTREQRRIAEEGGRRERAPGATLPGPNRLVVAGVAAGIGILFLVVSFFMVSNTVPLILGVIGLTLGMVLGIQWWDQGHRAKRYDSVKSDAERMNDRRIWEIRGDEESARDRVLELVADLPIHDALLEAPSLDLPSSLERIKELVADREDRVGVRQARVRKLEETIFRIEELSSTLALPLPPEALEDATPLFRLLKEALDHRESARAAERDLQRIRREKEQAEQELNEIAAVAHSLARRLLRFGGGDLGKGVEEATRRIELRTKSKQLREELEREYPDLELLQVELEQLELEEDAGTPDSEARAASAARVEELTEQVEELRATVETLRTEIQHLESAETVDQVDSRIGSLRARLDDTIRQRDRAWVLGQLVREADRRFREAHQPDILRSAGEQLSHITDGRYNRIIVGEGSDEAFYLKGADYPKPVKVGAPISTGTREQVYLALRLAIIDHLDARGERLPLFMDEAFVNWDAGRRDRAFELMRQIAETRQIFFFTCHPDMAQELAERGGQIIRLTETVRPLTPR